jgi:phage portal protein BeeE
MKLFGFNISRGDVPASEQKSISYSPEEWLRGEDVGNGARLTNAYEQVVWVYRAINVLAEQVANVPFLFSSGERGRENLITSGPLLDFYARPHPQINRFQYWELRILWLMLRGECFRIPIYEDQLDGTRRGGSGKRRLRRVLILDPARFQHIVEDHKLIGWRYTGYGSRAPLASQVFLPEEVWFEKLPNPFDFWRGLAPLQAAVAAANTDFAAGAFMRGIIENNGDTGLLVRTEKPLAPEQLEQLKAHLRERKGRAGMADRPLVLSGVNEIVKPQISSSDLQFLENRKFSRAEICAAFGVPEEIVTATDHAKYDVMQGARQNFIENRVAPLCGRLEAEEDVVVNSLDEGAVGWFDLDSLPILQQARRNRLITAKTGFDMGVPFNELNRVLDLGFKALPWGEEGFLPGNLQALKSGKADELRTVEPRTSNLELGKSKKGNAEKNMKTDQVPQTPHSSPTDPSEFKVRSSTVQSSEFPLSEFEDRLVTLYDGRHGLRGGIHMEVREPSAGEQQASGPGPAAPILDFIASDETLDRYDEIILAQGWKLENYRRNPVFQNAHKYGDIIFTLGKALFTEVREGRLVQRIEFATEVNPMARIAYGLYRGKFLNAVSVGFVPLRWENGGAEAGYRRKYLEQELLEVSAVGIPANPNALQLGLKAGAIEQSDLLELEEMLRLSANSRQICSTQPVPNSPAGDSGAGTYQAQMLQLARYVREALKG